MGGLGKKFGKDIEHLQPLGGRLQTLHVLGKAGELHGFLSFFSFADAFLSFCTC